MPQAGLGPTRIMAPALHRGAHGQNLVFEPGAGIAGHQMQLERDVVRQAERAVFAGDQQGSRFTAGAS